MSKSEIENSAWCKNRIEKAAESFNLFPTFKIFQEPNLLRFLRADLHSHLCSISGTFCSIPSSQFQSQNVYSEFRERDEVFEFYVDIFPTVYFQLKCKNKNRKNKRNA